MNDSNNISTQIAAYLEGRMSPAEMTAFEDARNNDPQLDSEVKLTLLLRAGLAQERLDQQRATLKDLLKEQAPDSSISAPDQIKGGIMRPMWRYAALAAGILLLAGLVWNYGFKQSQASPAELFASNYGIPSAPEQMGLSDSAESVLLLGHAAFNAKQYSEAAAYYQQSVTLDIPAEKAPWLYLGIASVETGDIATAREAFTQAMNNQPERAAWYLALLELKEGRVAEAKSRLDEIAKVNGHYYQTKAKSLLGELGD
ncbi:MAG: tetratricopeptide repeat protein [Bacteroidia bacterium]